MVVKYFFQPVVENAFQHGIREKQGGHIDVDITREAPRRIRYRVRDDGVGMDAQRLAQVRGAIQNHTVSSGRNDCFALINIDRQLKMYFGEDYTFEIDSQPNMGTSVTLVFPLG